MMVHLTAPREETKKYRAETQDVTCKERISRERLDKKRVEDERTRSSRHVTADSFNTTG
jgi:hypothetical protein